MKKPLYYPDYIQLDKLLSAQELESAKQGKPAHDEMLFIITHQSYELWFKQIDYELNSILALMSGEALCDQSIPKVVARLRRIIVIMKNLVSLVDVLETMTPMAFLEFRDCLIPASGFQSFQFRLFEIKLGFQHDKNSSFMNRFDDKTKQTVSDALQSDSLFDCVERWLARMPFANQADFTFWQAYREALQKHFEIDLRCLQMNEHLTAEEKAQQTTKLEQTWRQFDNFFDETAYQDMLSSGDRRLNFKATMSALFIMLYRDYPILQMPFRLISSLVDIDNLLTQWRYRHVQLAQRMIGAKIGTGGSAGSEYLKSTVSKKIFSDINQLTVYLLSQSALPELPASFREKMMFQPLD